MTTQNKKFTLTIVIAWLSAMFSFATETDSIQKLIDGKEGVEKIELLNKLALSVRNSKPQMTVEYGKQALKLSERSNFLHGQGKALSNIGLGYQNMGDGEKSMRYYERALDLFKTGKDSSDIAVTLNRMALLYYAKSNNGKAQEFLLKALPLFEALNDQKNTATVYVNLANIHVSRDRLERALELYSKAIKVYQELEYWSGLSTCLNNVASIYVKQEMVEPALNYYEKALELYEKTNNQSGIAHTYANMANVNVRLKKYNKARKLLNKSLEISLLMESRSSVALAYHGLAELNRHTGNHKIADSLYLLSQEICLQLGYIDLLLYNYKSISENFTAKGDFKKALDSYIKFSNLQDSLNKDKGNQSLVEKELQYKFDKSQREQEFQMLIQQEKLRTQKIYTTVGIAGFLLMFTLTIVAFRNYQTKKRAHVEISVQKDIIEEKNKDITDSITYAQRIQNAILPSEKLIRETLPESFVLYKPKDVVSGDFYWLDAPSKGGGVIPPSGRLRGAFFAAADCTGHGVPGAMVSVVCHNALNRSVREFGLSEPGKILDKTRELVIETFEKSEEDVKDGMDIALCSLQLSESSELSESWRLQYAGANNPLWIIPNEPRENLQGFQNLKGLYEIRADKQPIGKQEGAKPFTNYTIELQKGDTIYIFSDGFVDQFGGENQSASQSDSRSSGNGQASRGGGKKFKSKAFKQLLLSIQDKPMQEQKQIIDEAFENWKGELEQVDDVCVIGVRV